MIGKIGNIRLPNYSRKLANTYFTGTYCKPTGLPQHPFHNIPTSAKDDVRMLEAAKEKVKSLDIRNVSDYGGKRDLFVNMITGSDPWFFIFRTNDNEVTLAINEDFLYKNHSGKGHYKIKIDHKAVQDKTGEILEELLTKDGYQSNASLLRTLNEVKAIPTRLRPSRLDRRA